MGEKKDRRGISGVWPSGSFCIQSGSSSNSFVTNTNMQTSGEECLCLQSSIHFIESFFQLKLTEYTKHFFHDSWWQHGMTACDKPELERRLILPNTPCTLHYSQHFSVKVPEMHLHMVHTQMCNVLKADPGHFLWKKCIAIWCVGDSAGCIEG